ncbi:hypothetical protein FXF68_09465 [Actinomadura decatromicini]|uniref:Oxidoreductase n=1 Tax=Actinomadura decatromicini TaxID=2604572 RepID=A0A5D3FSJ2_9ACTN|nr:hypothetical protein FXF68_09465 [Actinomadura decatromicini]
MAAEALTDAILSVDLPKAGLLSIVGARIIGRLDLSAREIPKVIRFRGCYFDDEVDLKYTDARSISFALSSISRLNLAATSIHGNLLLDEADIRDGVTLYGGSLSGSLSCKGAKIACRDWYALDASLCNIGGALLCGENFHAEGGVSIARAHVGGDVNFNSAQLTGHKNRPALSGQDTKIDGQINLSYSSSSGGVDLRDSRIGGNVECVETVLRNKAKVTLDASGARISGRLDAARIDADGGIILRACEVDALTMAAGRIHNDGGGAVELSDIQTGRSIDLRNVNILGHVTLVDGNVGRDLILSGARLKGGRSNVSVYAEGLSTRGGIYLTRSFESSGGLDFDNARIGGSFYGTKAIVRTNGGTALSLRGTVIGGDLELQSANLTGDITGRACDVGRAVILDQIEVASRKPPALNLPGLKVGSDFSASKAVIDGGISLAGASISGEASFIESEVKGIGDLPSLSLDRGELKGQLSFAHAKLHGQIRLHGAHIHAVLSFDNTVLTCPRKKKGEEIVALIMRHMIVDESVYAQFAEIGGAMDLIDARVGAWRDVKDAWPEVIAVVGFKYNAITGSPKVTIKDRLEWCNRNKPSFALQPFEQLAQVCRASGNEEDARKIGIEMQRLLRNHNKSEIRKLVTVPWSFTLRVLIGYGYKPWRIVVPFVIFAIIGTIIFSTLHADGHITTVPGPRKLDFNSFRYTVDLLFPVALLGQRGNFVVDSVAAWFSFFFTVTGWFLTYIFIAGLAGIFKRA